MPTIANLKKFHSYATDIQQLRYSHEINGRKESWLDIATRVTTEVIGKFNLPRDVKRAIHVAIIERKFIPGGRILSQAGREYHQTDNCFLLKAEDTREGWAELAYKATMMFMSGGGVGVDYSDIRGYGHKLYRSGGISSGPIPLIEMINSIGAAARQGGERRGAIYASLAWDHSDIDSFIRLKEHGGLEHTNISVRFDKRWLVELDSVGFNVCKATESFQDTLKHACKYGDPGFQFDNDSQILRNACTEVISADDCDSCCLGSINLSKIHSLSELYDITELGTLFLLCATLYTDIPYSKVYEVKNKNRRLGLGLMGVAEWFLQRKQQYGNLNSSSSLQRNPSLQQDSFQQWLSVYKESSDKAADRWSSFLSINKPIAVRAIAPTGTISIAGGHTTPGIEPVFHTAYERTYNTLKDKVYKNGLHTERVIDPIVAKWIEDGHDVRDIDTAWTLSQTPEGIERRIAFQAFCQRYIDNAISSTVNLPAYEEGIENTIAPILLKYLPQLRGITFYPDGRHQNQPVRPIDIQDVIENNNVVMVENESCKGGVCGI